MQIRAVLSMKIVSTFAIENQLTLANPCRNNNVTKEFFPKVEFDSAQRFLLTCTICVHDWVTKHVFRCHLCFDGENSCQRLFPSLTQNGNSKRVILLLIPAGAFFQKVRIERLYLTLFQADSPFRKFSLKHQSGTQANSSV